MARLLPLLEFRECVIADDDPLRWYYHPLLGRLYQRRVDVAVGLIPPGRRVLEVGYGSGTSLLELDDRFREVHGVDAHGYGGRIAEIFARHGVRLRLSRGSVDALPYASERFDAVLALSILEHLPVDSQDGAMREIRRVLRPGGIVVVGVPGLNALMSVAFRLMGCDIRQHHFSSPRVVRAAATRHFAIDRVVTQPPGAPAALMTYQWFRGLKARSPLPPTCGTSGS
ncbi:MAG: class I SAM-dependent methyltransferase [Candidatus Rokubacteria bacterium]|nr:class I SAM-dependent methyltransferase [Candidatus Rokubacteria bacterium]